MYIYNVYVYFQVVDARAGPGTKSTLKMKNKLSPTMQKYKSPLKAKNRSSTQLQQAFSSIPSPLPEELSGKYIRKIKDWILK